MAFLPLAAAAVGGFASYQQSVAANKAGAFNAQAAESEAAQTRQQGIQNEVRQRQKTNLIIGQQRAGYGASGVDVNTGSANLVQADTAKFGELDALQTRANANNRARSLDTQANAYRAQRSNPFLAAGSTILTSLALPYGLKSAKLPTAGGGIPDPFGY